MTIYEAGGHLFKWYSDKDSYCPNKDHNKLILVSDTLEEDKAAVLCALGNFEENNIVKRKKIGEDDYWVLNQKFSATPQSIEISSATALKVYGLVNLYTESTGLSEDYECDPLNISEKDINILVTAIMILSKK